MSTPVTAHVVERSVPTGIDFSLFAGDARLKTLAGLSLTELHRALERALPLGVLEQPVHRYSVANFRYDPGKKLVIGMTAPASLQTLGIRVVPPGQLPARLAKARRGGKTGAFPLEAASALVWVFPGERKLSLDILADRTRLAALLQRSRGLALKDIDLVHFVPEHTYTARTESLDGKGQRVRDYLKIDYDGSGARTASIMAALERQCADMPIRLATLHGYLPRHHLLLQASLDVVRDDPLGDLDAARGLACFHRLWLPGSLHARPTSTPHETAETRARRLISRVFPTLCGRHERACLQLSALRKDAGPTRAVVLHGDAHPGNLCRTRDGRIGMIDLDAVQMGAPEDDLAGYYASRLWQSLRRGDSLEPMFDAFPAFIDAYNVGGELPVPERIIWTRLAAALLHERVSRAIARVKIGGEGEMTDLIMLGEYVLMRASRAGQGLHA